MTGRGVKRSVNVLLQCEWGSCTYVASKMEEFCAHVSDHLEAQHLGTGEENMDCEGKICRCRGPLILSALEMVALYFAANKWNYFYKESFALR